MQAIADNNDVALWLALSQINGLGNATLCQLLSHFGSPDAIFSAQSRQLREVVSEPIAIAIQKGVNADDIAPTINWLSQENNHVVTLADNHYPPLLLEISNPPAILYAKGNLQRLQLPAIAMVGSRSSTPQGEKNAEDFAQHLCQQGFCIVSGLALGIDGAAHRGTLKATGPNKGATIAVVGTGLDIVYPAKHRDLAHHIVQHGLILSEFPLGTPSKAQNFPRRNRIISGLSLGCLVVEANIESGSLITARLSAEQGREVFAIPSSIHSPVAKGCHQLIKQGAKLVESVQDIVEELSLFSGQNFTKTDSPSGLSPDMAIIAPETNTVLACMGFEPISFERIRQMTDLTTDALSAMLMMLELEGKITPLTGGQYQRLM
jgi:DNA processing protein